MTNTQPDKFSQFIASIFAKFGIADPFTETILLRNRFYVGRRFRAGDIQIVWWNEKNLLEIFNSQAQSLEIIELEQKYKKIA